MLDYLSFETLGLAIKGVLYILLILVAALIFIITIVVAIGILNGSYSAKTKICSSRRKRRSKSFLHFRKGEEIYEGRPDSEAGDRTEV